jgi:hypothetical protein
MNWTEPFQRGGRWGEKVAQTMYTYVSKCKNDKKNTSITNKKRKKSKNTTNTC